MFSWLKRTKKGICVYHWVQLQVDGISGEEISAHTLLSKAIRIARYLQEKLGIKSGKLDKTKLFHFIFVSKKNRNSVIWNWVWISGDVISICSENRIEFVISLHAILLLGATVAPLNLSYIQSTFPLEYCSKQTILSTDKFILTSNKRFIFRWNESCDEPVKTQSHFCVTIKFTQNNGHGAKESICWAHHFVW